MKFLSILGAVFFLIPGFLPAQETEIPPGILNPGPDFKAGEELFVRNKPSEALPYLEKAFVADQTNVNAALYLAMCYEQLDRLDEAITVYRRILPAGGPESARIAFNLGNVYYRKGSAGFAEQFYTQAIRSDPVYAPAYLNRANTRVKTGALRDALPDYQRYLHLEPESPKRPQIEKLVALIQEEFAAEEIRRLMAEEAARAEAERRQRLMDEVSASLQAQADEAEGVSATPEDLSGYDGEFELE
ncbi:MAG: tetratricopeptide repeat protein [Spirochaetaceae bacterium]|nr:tetratricopeptide repeat protein [Spirochaetaceae bacterium]